MRSLLPEGILSEAEKILNRYDRKLLNIFPDSVIIIDNDNNITNCNFATTQIFQKPCDEIVGSKCYELFHAENEPIAGCPHQKLLKSRQRETMELQIAAKWYLITADPIIDDDGELLGSFHFARDITKQKQAENIKWVIIKILEAVTTTRDLPDLFSSIHSFLSVILDVKNFYIALYDEVNDLLNFPYYHDEKVIFHPVPAPKTLTNHVIKTRKSLFADEQTQKELHDRGIIGEADPGTEAKIWMGVPLKKDDRIIGVVSVQSYDDADAFSPEDVLLLEMVSDTIALAIIRKQYINELKASEEKFRLFHDNTLIGLYRTTPDGRIIMANKALLDLLECDSFEQLRQRNLEKDGYNPNYNRQLFKEIIDKQGEIKELDSSWLTSKGKTIFIRESAKAVYNEKGEIIYYDGVIEDITEKKRRDTIDKVLLKISQSASTIDDLYSVLHAIRQHLSELIETTNFGVAIHNQKDGSYFFPYYADEFEQISKNHIEFLPDSLTDYVRRTGRSILLDANRMNALIEQDEIRLYGPDSKVWLGVPLQTASGTIGVLSLQSYGDADAYSESDLELLDKVAGSIAIVVEKKNAEEALKRSQQQLSLALESAGLGLWDQDYRTGKVFRNRIWAEMLGYLPEEVEGTLDFFIKNIHPDDLPLFQKSSYETEHGLIDKFDVEHRLKTKDGKWKWIRNWGRVVEWTEKGEPARIIGTHLDIDEEKRMRLALRENEEKYRQIFENSTELICIFNLQGIIVDVNPAAEKITGLPIEKLRGLNFFDYIPAASRMKTLRVIGKCLKTEEPVKDYAFEIQIPGREPLHFEGSLVAVRKNGEVVGFHGNARDITHRIQTEKQLHQQRDHIKLINSILRHDIANIFAVISSALNIYRRSQEAVILDEAVRHIKKGISLIHKMKNLEEFYSIHSTLKPFQLSFLIKEIASTYNQLETSVKGDCQVIADEALASVFDNLFSNAAKHGGASRIQVLIYPHNIFCTIEFMDDGSGIPDEIKSWIFDKDFTYGERKSTGLGLHIVKKTIERYGGSIRIEDNFPTGAKFIIELKCL